MPESSEKPHNQSGYRVAKAASTVSIFTLLSRIFGMVRDMVTANYFGAGMITDAFFVAFKLPNLLRRLVAEGTLSSAFVPIFTDELEHHKERSKQSLHSIISFTLLLTGVLTILGLVFSEELVYLFAPGFAKTADKLELAATLTRVMFPYVMVIAMLALYASVLNCLGVFSYPAASPVSFNIALILAILIFSPAFDIPIFSLAWAVPIGGFLSLLPQLRVAKKLGYGFGIHSPFKSPAVNHLVKLMVPSIFSSSLYQVMVFVNTVLASLLIEGSVSWLYYSDRLFQFPLGVFSVAVATAILPSLSRFASQGRDDLVSVQLHQALNWITFITIPASVGLIVVATPLVRVVYEYGNFDSASTAMTAVGLAGYAIGLWPISCQTVLVRTFLAKKNTKTPALISCISLLLNLFLAVLMMGPITSAPKSIVFEYISWLHELFPSLQMRHVGLALAGSLASFFSMWLSAVALKSIHVEFSMKRLIPTLITTCVATAVMAVSLEYFSRFFSNDIINMLISVIVGGGIFFLVSLLLRNEEAHSVKKAVKNYLAKRSKSATQ